MGGAVTNVVSVLNTMVNSGPKSPHYKTAEYHLKFIRRTTYCQMCANSVISAYRIFNTVIWTWKKNNREFIVFNFGYHNNSILGKIGSNTDYDIEFVKLSK